MTGALARLVLVVGLLAGCGPRSAQPRHEPLDDALYARHEAAIGAFQRTLDHGPGDPSWRCTDLCRASDDACQTAAALCTQSGRDRRCRDAHRGCDWTLTLMPRSCRYCVTSGDAPPAP